MTETSSLIAYRRLRAPRDDGGTLFDPPIDDEAAFLQQNIALREQSDGDIRGRTLHELRGDARRSVLRQAYAYTSAYRDVSDVPLECSSSLIMTGHQPELVHPGVWFKNFLLSELARRTSSCAVNLLIDNDALRNSCVRVPGGRGSVRW